ncbi:hypothetical protein [Labrys wisconsinensis]|uniref:Transposase n=1 Tax=Labrys wisconsinensis TaxID=425677 RepID=A0ABU0J6Y6_9HYPH|nr:hypothetical protein [Labrys wisconsinensis]MDQ0470032.1 hypothetical protein [Labrys wisconsinensis]
MPAEPPAIIGDAKVIVSDRTFRHLKSHSPAGRWPVSFSLVLDPKAAWMSMRWRNMESRSTPRGQGDTAAAECAIALMWMAAQGVCGI